MQLLPNDAKKIEIANATVDFFEYIQDGLTFYYFDTSACGPPEPMVNAMLGLQLLDNDNKRLIMINHKAPGGLFPKIEENYTYEVSQIDGMAKVVFAFKGGNSNDTDFSSNKCGG